MDWKDSRMIVEFLAEFRIVLRELNLIGIESSNVLNPEKSRGVFRGIDSFE